MSELGSNSPSDLQMAIQEKLERQDRLDTMPPTAHAQAELALPEWLRHHPAVLVAISRLLAATAPRPPVSRPKRG